MCSVKRWLHHDHSKMASSSPTTKSVRVLSPACYEQVDKDVIDVLQHTWLDGHLAAVREGVKKCDRCEGMDWLRVTVTCHIS